MSNNEHSYYGPSSLPPRAVCPCYDSTPGGASAQSGTRSHRVVEAILKGEDTAKLPDTITAAEREAGEWGAATIMRIRDSVDPEARIQSESRVKFGRLAWIAEAIARQFADIHGTCDAFFSTVDAEGVKTLHVLDYKTYGRQDGEKDYAPQLMMYAILVASLLALAERPDYVKSYVVNGGDRSVVTSEFRLTDAVSTCERIIRRAKASRALFDSPTDAAAAVGCSSAWCKYCIHAANCPALSREVQLVSDNSPSILEKPLAVRMAIVPALENFAKAVKDEVKRRLEAGEEVTATSRDGTQTIAYRLKTRAGSAKLADFEGLTAAAEEYGVDMDAFMTAATMSKSAVESLFKDADAKAGRKVKKGDREAAYLPYFTQGAAQNVVTRIS